MWQWRRSCAWAFHERRVRVHRCWGERRCLRAEWQSGECRARPWRLRLWTNGCCVCGGTPGPPLRDNSCTCVCLACLRTQNSRSPWPNVSLSSSLSGQVTSTLHTLPDTRAPSRPYIGACHAREMARYQDLVIKINQSVTAVNWAGSVRRPLASLSVRPR